MSETINSIREDVLKRLSMRTFRLSLWKRCGYRRPSGAPENDFDSTCQSKSALDKEPELHEETLRERIYETSAGGMLQGKKPGAEMMRHFEKGACCRRWTSQGKSTGDGLPASDPPAWLCAERS